MSAKIVEAKNIEGHLNLKIAGCIYSEQANYFKQTLATYLDQNIVSLSLDLENMRYIDAAGLGALLCVKRIACERGQGFQINKVSNILSELFAINQLTHLLPSGKVLAENIG